MKNRINKIFKLKSGKKYLVIKQAVYREESYCVTVGVTDDEEDFTEEVIIFKEILKDNRPYMEQVKDPRLIELVAKYVGLIDPKDVAAAIAKIEQGN